MLTSRRGLAVMHVLKASVYLHIPICKSERLLAQCPPRAVLALLRQIATGLSVLAAPPRGLRPPTTIDQDRTEPKPGRPVSKGSGHGEFYRALSSRDAGPRRGGARETPPQVVARRSSAL